VSEGLSVSEGAHAVEHGREHAHERRARLVEMLEACVLAAVAIATAWGGYQAARWDGRQSKLYAMSSKNRALATQQSTRSGQLQLYDSSVFSFWLQATSEGRQEVAARFEQRFRPEFRTAFHAWLRTDPFTNPSAPPGPLLMPSYHDAAADRAAAFNRRATELFTQGTEARASGDRYVRDTLLLATVLFLTALAQRFRRHVLRVTLLGVSGALLVVALTFFAVYPRA
jgi:hypothetical protein